MEAQRALREEDRQHQPVARPRRRDVQQAPLLGPRVDLLPVARGRVARRLEAPLGGTDLEVDPARVAVHDRDLPGAVRRRRHLGQDHDGELQPLGLMDGQQPHDVVVDLRHRRLRLRQVGARLRAQPAHERAQRVDLVGGEVGRPLHDDLQVGRAQRAPAGELDLQQVRLAQDQIDVGRQRQRGLAGGQGAQRLDRPPQRSVVAVGQDVAAQLEAGAARPAVARAGGALGVGQPQKFHVRRREGRALQRRHDRHLVRRVVEGGEDGRRVADLLVLEEAPPAVQVVGHPRRVERLRVQLDRRAVADQQADVAEAGRPPAAGGVGVAHGHRTVVRRHHREDQPGQRRRLVAAGLVGPAPAGPGVGAQRDHAGAAVLPVRDQRLVRRLRVREVVVGRDHRGEDVVLPGDEVGPGAEVRAQHVDAGAARLGRGGGAESILDLGVDVDVGPAEAVDRLLRVADEEEPSRLELRVAPAGRVVARRQQHHDLRLQRVGVLELVDQQEAVAAPEVMPHARLLLEQVARVEQQVLERQPPGSAAAPPPPPRRSGGHVDELRQGLRAHAGGVGLVLLLQALPVLQQPHPVLAATAAERGRLDHQRRQVPLDHLRRRRLQRLQVRDQLRRPRLQRLRHVGRALADPPRAQETGRQLGAGQGRRLGDVARLQVAELGDLEGQVAQVAQLESQPQAALDARPGGALLLAPEPVLPVLVEGELLADGVHHLEGGVEPGVERALAQQARCEGVDRLDVGRVHLPDGASQAALHRRVGAGQRLVQLPPHAIPQLPGRLLGERDRDDLAQFGAARAHRLDHPPHQHRRLAGAGPRLQEDRRVEVALGGLAHRLVGGRAVAGGGGGRRAHRRACSFRKSCTTPWSSRDLRSTRLFTSVVQTLT